MSVNLHPLESIEDIRRMMNRSSRFLSLSGWSGISAGLIALLGALLAKIRLDGYYDEYQAEGYRVSSFVELRSDLFILAMLVMAAALLAGWYFTWRRSLKRGERIWDVAARKLLWSLVIPMAAGGLFIAGMLYHQEWRFIAGACLAFYGTALLNGSRYTLSEIRYLGYTVLLLSAISVFFPGKGLYFWAFGFGVCHIVYGCLMLRHERGEAEKG